MKRRLLLLVPALLLAAHARTLPPHTSRPLSPQTIPALPGQVQPVAPGTRPAPSIPTLTLTPPVPQVDRVEVLGNGFIEVAHAVLLVTPAEQGGVRSLAAQVTRRMFAARPGLAEVDLSVYDRGSYAGFGGPLPLMTASVPRGRLNDFLNWTATGAFYERVWVNAGNLPAYRAPDRIREVGPTLQPSPTPGSPVAQNRASIRITTAQVVGGLHGGLLYRGKRGTAPVAALTFDDAPHPLYEPLLLDLLRRSGVRATFFVIGRNAQAYPYFVRDMVAGGHEVGNHTYHHVRLPPLPLADAFQEMRLASETIRALTGQPVRYFRPPGGEYTPETLRAAESLGLTTVFWTDDPGDFTNPGDATLESRLKRGLRPGGIVLLHDNAPEMLDVLRGFLRVARQEDVRLTTVGGLQK
ncbi:polysaccharide deacetylase family protein [Deinococcus apachensis]|uniref:polysaccharide deacetylase family protein n=1 Tax=Deinococcus apachensis TaxID=309886 RepID=UPI0003A43AEE|nr:polysaccharide deacetylase family protein [Deinococcus apachensis]